MLARLGRVVTAERALELDDHQRLELAVDIAAPDGHYTAEARDLSGRTPV